MKVWVIAGENTHFFKGIVTGPQFVKDKFILAPNWPKINFTGAWDKQSIDQRSRLCWIRIKRGNPEQRKGRCPNHLPRSPKSINDCQEPSLFCTKIRRRQAILGLELCPYALSRIKILWFQGKQHWDCLAVFSRYSQDDVGWAPNGPGFLERLDQRRTCNWQG